MRNILSQLQADVAYEEDLRRFHRRYFPLCELLDNSTWTQVFFMRCANPANTVAGFFDKTKGNHHFWTDKPAAACPHCGYQIRKKKATEYTLSCQCGSKAAVFELEKGYMAHCPSCGAVTFFDNPILLQRLHFGGKLCPHELEKKPCRGGHTTWCPICRVRSFIYER